MQVESGSASGAVTAVQTKTRSPFRRALDALVSLATSPFRSSGWSLERKLCFSLSPSGQTSTTATSARALFAAPASHSQPHTHSAHAQSLAPAPSQQHIAQRDARSSMSALLESV